MSALTRACAVLCWALVRSFAPSIEITSPLEGVTNVEDGKLSLSAHVLPEVPGSMLRFVISGSVFLGRQEVEEQKDFTLSPCPPPCHSSVNLMAIQLRLGLNYGSEPICCYFTARLEVNTTVVAVSESSFFSIAPLLDEPVLHLPLRNASHHWTEFVPTARLAVVVMDPWNWHWCKTAERRMDAMVPRLNAALRRFRNLGVAVIFAPTINRPSHAPMVNRNRDNALVIPYSDVPTSPTMIVEGLAFAQKAVCMCGATALDHGCPIQATLANATLTREMPEHAWIHPNVEIEPDDFVIVGGSLDTHHHHASLHPGIELYSLLSYRKIQHVIYAGFHANECVVAKFTGMAQVKMWGFNVSLARDLTDAVSSYDPHGSLTPDSGTSDSISVIEQSIGPTVAAADIVASTHWIERWLADDQPSRPLPYALMVAPWGSESRPHKFRGSVRVTLSAPWFLPRRCRSLLKSAPAGTPQTEMVCI